MKGAQVAALSAYGSLDNKQLPLHQIKEVVHYLENLDLSWVQYRRDFQDVPWRADGCACEWVKYTHILG